MKIISTILFSILFLLTGNTKSQSPQFQTNVGDSLLAVWNDESKPDSSRLKALNKIAWDGYLFTQPDSAFYYSQIAYDLGKEKGLKKIMAAALNTQGISFFFLGDFDKAKEYLNLSLELREEIGIRKGIIEGLNNIGLVYQKLNEYDVALSYQMRCLKLTEEEGDKKKIGEALNNIGTIYSILGDYASGIEYHTRSLKIREEINDKHGVAASLGNIGIIYMDQGEYDKALDLYAQSLKINEEIGDKQHIAYVLVNIGIVYKDKGDYDSALDYYTRSLQISEEILDKRGIVGSSNNIGYIHLQKGEYDKALEYHTRSLKIEEEIGDKLGVAFSLTGIGNVYLKQDNYANAIKYGKKALNIAKGVGAVKETRDAAETLWEAYKKSGRYKESLEMHELFITYSDSIQTEENKEEIINQEMKYKYDKKKAADSIKNTEEKRVQDALLMAETSERKRQQQKAYYLYIGLGVAVLIGLFIFNRFRVARSQKQIIEEQKSQVDQSFSELEEKNREILDSIHYAKRIQAAILPPAKLVKEYLKNSFIFYKPKDIVAGDFYWMEHKGDKILFAACDCTGHGVPGAMVSVICNNGLNRAVREHGITDPGKILDKTREIVIQEFEKSEEEVKDGMDIALCSIQGNKLEYAGAHNPLWIIRNGEIIETKANKQPIGKFFNQAPYKTHSFDLEKGDTIYIFSDGYQDQFGGDRGKKFKTVNFKSLLVSIQSETMEQQKILIDAAFKKWKGEYEQVDDVCIIGVRV